MKEDLQGVTLYQRIKAEIKRNGGNLQTAFAIEREWGLISSQHAGNKRIWTSADEHYLLINFSQVTVRDLAKALDRSQDAVMSKYLRMTDASMKKYVY